MLDDSLMKSAVERLEKGSEEIRHSAIKALSRRNSLGAVPFLIEAVGDESYRIREEALKGICSFPANVIFPRLESYIRNHDNANLRNAALETFPRYGNKATLFLLGLLTDDDKEVRMFSGTLLGDIRDPEAVDGLILALKDEDENVKHAAAESLGKIKDPRAVGPLIECLNEDFWIQYPAVVALGDIGDPSATEHLINLLDDEMLQQAVIEALGKIGDLSTIPVLAEILYHNEPSLRNDTIAALIKIQSRIEKYVDSDGSCLPSIKNSLNDDELIDHLMNSLQDPDIEVRKNAVIALGWLKEKRTVKDMIELLNDYELEEYVVGSLVSIGEQALPGLIQYLESPDPKTKSSIIRCIGWIGNPEAVKVCLSYLNDDNFEVKYQAVMTASNALDCEDVEDALLSKLSDPDPEILGALIELLGKSRSPHLVNKLLPELSSEISQKKLAAIKILGRIKDRDAYEPLRALLNDESDEVRADVYRALSAIFPSRLTTEILLEGLSDRSPVVRRAAASSLEVEKCENIEGSLTPLINDPDPEVRHMVIETLGKMGCVSCIGNLIDVFNDGDKRLKITIIRAMGNICDKTCTQFLMDLTKKGDTDIKRNSMESLGLIRDKRAVPGLVVALDDTEWSVRRAAIKALGNIGDRRCVVHILEKLDDREDIVKKEAIVTLGRIGARNTVNFILPLIHNENLQLEVIHALEKLGIQDMDFFFDFMKRANTRIKCMLVDMLGRMKAAKAVDYLIDILEDEFYTVRSGAAKALGETEQRRAIPHLLKAQKKDPSSDVQKEAARALKKLDAIK